MGKHKKFFFAAAVIAAVGFSTYTALDLKCEVLFPLVLDNIESLARGELPEVEITCGNAENKGRCWDGDCEPFYTPFGFAKAWDCYRATGNPNDVCVQDAPCL